MSEETYSNIREIIGEVIGKTLIDVTQHDPEQFEEEGSFVQLHFDDGSYLKFPIGDLGFHHNIGDDEDEDGSINAG